METIRKEIKMSYPSDRINPLVEVGYYKSDEIFIILNESREMLVVNQQNIPALIAMLQSINSGLK